MIIFLHNFQTVKHKNANIINIIEKKMTFLEKFKSFIFRQKINVIVPKNLIICRIL